MPPSVQQRTHEQALSPSRPA